MGGLKKPFCYFCSAVSVLINLSCCFPFSKGFRGWLMYIRQSLDKNQCMLLWESHMAGEFVCGVNEVSK